MEEKRWVLLPDTTHELGYLADKIAADVLSATFAVIRDMCTYSDAPTINVKRLIGTAKLMSQADMAFKRSGANEADEDTVMYQVFARCFDIATNCENLDLTGNEADRLMFFYKWYKNNFPLVRIDAATSASLALTEWNDNAASMFRVPWGAFLVASDLMGGALVLVMWHELESKYAINHKNTGMVSTLFYDKQQGSQSILWQRYLHPETVGIREETKQSLDIRMGSGMLSMTESELRLCTIGRRIAAGACIAMADPSDVFSIRMASGKPATKASSGAYSGGKYAIGSNVNVDLSEEVVRYIRDGVGTKHKSRWVVRGHWRNQACGKRLEDRRLQWIQPHWKGHNDAPKLIREHVLEA